MPEQRIGDALQGPDHGTDAAWLDFRPADFCSTNSNRDVAQLQLGIPFHVRSMHHVTHPSPSYAQLPSELPTCLGGNRARFFLVGSGDELMEFAVNLAAVICSFVRFF